ncbi:MAG TPA: hypothetical protein VN901_27100 [Candidatus Acidoferrales bacterium]|nr:hypothetical protein [Candidatus Acidoferrales bacterium]
MKRKTVKMIALAFFALALALGAARQARAQDAKTPYPSMARLDQYLIADRNAEIALARTAAPPSISRDATVMVLGSHAYETGAEGKNGFVCIVERAWMNPFDSPEFWNPKNRSPICLNPPAARTVLPLTLMRTKLVLAGKSKEEVKESVKAAIEKKELPALEAGAMSYMMSKDAYLTDLGSHNMAHLMFYTPLGTAWGANLVDSSNQLSEPFPGSPLLLAPSFKGNPEPIHMFLMGTGVWSDGTTAPM